MVIAGGGIIVKDTRNKSHEANDVIGYMFEQHATDCHVSVVGTTLVQQNQP